VDSCNPHLSERDHEASERWLDSRGYHTEGNPGFENKLAFAEWMSGREISERNLDLAMGNVQRTTRRKLHPKPKNHKAVQVTTPASRSVGCRRRNAIQFLWRMLEEHFVPKTITSCRVKERIAVGHQDNSLMKSSGATAMFCSAHLRFASPGSDLIR
jgi:hypothetical protein